MPPEHQRRERFTAYAHILKERFNSGMLSQLQGLPQWVVWRAELEDGKNKKIPYNPNHFNARASVKIPKSWGTLQEALTALEQGAYKGEYYSGIGFMITPPLVFIDLDNSYDRATQTITNPQAEIIMRAVNSYFEASPYKGLHGLVYTGRPISNLHTEKIEIYGYGRFTTITTDHIAGTPTTIELRTREVEALLRQFAPPDAERPIQNTGGVAGATRLSELPPEAANDTVLQELLSGDMSRYGNDHHRADWVLLMKLLHWTGDNKVLSKKIFLNSPLGQRDKAQEPEGVGRRGDTNYVDKTIERIIAKRRNPPMKR